MLTTSTHTSISTPTYPPIPHRSLGKTGCEVSQFGLGGEGVLRTHGRMAEAVAVIHRALDQGVTYCDTSPAYAGSIDYYGAALGERRNQVFLASKTHDRTRDGSLRLLDESLKRLRTNHLDLWQLHDLRTPSDLKMIFGRRGALEALVQARDEGRVRFLGVTGIMIRPSCSKRCASSISIPCWWRSMRPMSIACLSPKPFWLRQRDAAWA